MFELNGLHLDNWLDILGWAWIFIEKMTRAMKITYALVKDMLETVWETVLIVSYIWYEISCLRFDLLYIYSLRNFLDGSRCCSLVEMCIRKGFIKIKARFFHTNWIMLTELNPSQIRRAEKVSRCTKNSVFFYSWQMSVVRK